MSSDQLRQLLQRGIEAAKGGDAETARKYLGGALKLDPNNEIAWLALVSVTPNPKDRLRILKRVLEINPNNAKAKELLARLNITSEKPTTPPPPPATEHGGLSGLRAMMDTEEEEAPARPSLFATDDEADDPFADVDDAPARGLFDDSAPTAAPPSWAGEDAAPRISLKLGPRPQAGPYGLPIPDPDQLETMAAIADDIAQTYLAELAAAPDIPWKRKEKRRAGEREVWILRLQVAAMTLFTLAIVGGIGALFISNSPEAQEALFGPTVPPPSLTPTPTVTPSPTVGVTPTFSPTPEITHTPTPTIDPSITPVPTGAQPRPTSLYSPDRALVSERIREAIDLIAVGDYDRASELLETQRRGAPAYPWPYYLLAQINLRRDNPDAAQAILEEGEAQLETVREDLNYRPLIELGFAELALYRAQKALADNDLSAARSQYAIVEERANAAIQQDPRLLGAAVVLAQRYQLEGDNQAALEVINQALLSTNGAFTHIPLRLEQIKVYMAQGNYDAAIQAANEALYINAFTPAIHRLRIQAAIAKGDPGLGVLYAEAYRFFYPASVEAFKLEGDARRAEGKTDEALIAYTRALLGSADDPNFLEALLARAELYRAEGRYQAALDDYNAALEFDDSPQTRAARMEVAYAVGDYATALADSEALLGSGAVDDNRLRLLQARVRVDTAASGDSAAYEAALALLNQSISGGLSADLRPIADEYRARAQYALGNATAARAAIEDALEAGETGSRYYLRGLILEALGEQEAARADYEWVLTWGQIYPYPFIEDALERYQALTAQANEG